MQLPGQGISSKKDLSELVEKFDPLNQFSVLKDSYRQIEYAWGNKFKLDKLIDKKFNNIIVTGLGGSAISADLLLNFVKDELKCPLVSNRNYHLPLYAGKKTLLIVSSYSGNTEETISVFNKGLEKGCSIVCITTGGKIKEIAVKNKIPTVNIQPGLQPRYALGLSFFSLLRILQKLELIPKQNEAVRNILELWKKKGKDYSRENNQAFNYAEQLIGFIPVIYSAADITSSIGYRFKCQLNENSKLHAFHNVIPEMNHNEIIGWETYNPRIFNSKLINILDKDYPPQIRKRFDVTAKLASEAGIELINLESSELDFKIRIMDLIYLSDWITYYLAVLRGFDPTAIKNINILKKLLAE